MMKSAADVAGNAIACGLAVWACVKGCDAGPFAFPEILQHVMLAQQCGLQALSLGAFERMHEAAGNRSGMSAHIRTTANKVAALPRMLTI